MRLLLHEIRTQLRLYSRSRELAFFTFLLPLILFVLLGSVYGHDRIEGYKGSRYLGGPVRFVLGGSGHIAGIVNPPAAKKYHFWSNDALPETAEQWFAGAKQQPGSWWEDWQRWIDNGNGGEKVPARIPANAIEDAPGSYATLRLQK